MKKFQETLDSDFISETVDCPSTPPTHRAMAEYLLRDLNSASEYGMDIDFLAGVLEHLGVTQEALCNAIWFSICDNDL